MRRADIFPTLIALFSLGGGLYLSTFPVIIIQWIGKALMAMSVIGLGVWFDWRRLHAIPEKAARIVQNFLGSAC